MVVVFLFIGGEEKVESSSWIQIYYKITTQKENEYDFTNCRTYLSLINWMTMNLSIHKDFVC